MDLNKFATVLNTIVTPMLNPFIYSLRNEKVKESLRDAFNKYVGMLTNSRSLKPQK
ncbi:olfactory receptor 6M1-like [Prionailurus iriomotensis]